MRVALVGFARRGGMVHFHAELSDALSRQTRVARIGLADTRSPSGGSHGNTFAVQPGKGAWGSFWTGVNPLTWIRLFRWLRRINPDIIHIVAAHEWNPAVALISRALQTPMIYTVHDPLPHAGAPARMRISSDIVARMADALVVLTSFGSRQLQSQGYAPEKIHVIPHGIYSFFTRGGRHPKSQENAIVYFGRIEPYKGLDVLLDAFARIAQRLPTWKLVVAGSGRLPREIPVLPARQIEVVNRFLSDQEVATLMQRASIVVLPYLDASQSGVLAAAYAFGRPVVVSRVGGLPEMVVQGRTGVVVPPGDAKALARALARLARDRRQLHRMGREALKLGRSRWSWQRVARMHMSLYQSMLCGRPAA